MSVLPFIDELAAVLRDPRYGIASDVRSYAVSDRVLIYGDVDWDIEVTHDRAGFHVHEFQRGVAQDPVAVCAVAADVVRVLLLLHAGPLLRATGSRDPWVDGAATPRIGSGVDPRADGDVWIVEIEPGRSIRFTGHRAETLAVEFADAWWLPIPTLIDVLTSGDASSSLERARAHG